MPTRVRVDRPCGEAYRLQSLGTRTTEPHEPHDWDSAAGRFQVNLWRCPGYPRRPRLEVPGADAPRCTTTWTGPTGVVWDCIGAEHPTNPAEGLAGSGHTFRARPKVS